MVGLAGRGRGRASRALEAPANTPLPVAFVGGGEAFVQGKPTRFSKIGEVKLASDSLSLRTVFLRRLRRGQP